MAVRRKVIAKNLTDYKALSFFRPLATGGMTVVLREQTVSQLLPSYDSNAGTVHLNELLNLLESKRTGSEFYANGNPTLKGLSIEAQAQQIINNIIGDPK